ncbi:MAG TPA: protein kinase [Gemmataceae bacterium]|nr:protein kinase [Gemmataceae bacterium]
MNHHVATSLSDRILMARLLDPETLAIARTAVSNNEERLAHYLVREGLLTAYQVRQLRAGATKFHVDKYVIVDYIGRGGNAIVFKARHTLLPQRYVALKTFDTRDLHHDQESLARFRREIDIVARMDHPNVVRALDVLRTRRQIFLVLEYIEGKDLGTLVKQRGPLPVAEAVDYAVQAARGLAYAHRCGIVHRDLKPANLLLTRDNVVKLSDLGLARFLAHGPDAELTMKGQCLGTPEFMAPEQAEDARQADTRSDLYSLGGTLFHLLTAELPVRGSSQLQRLQQLLSRPPQPLLEVRPDVPPGLAAVVDRLRARNPADRPATAEEVIALLEPFLSQTQAEDPRSWDGRRKAELVLAVLRGQLTAADACKQYGLEPTEFDDWKERFLEGARRALETTGGLVEKLSELNTRICNQATEIENLKKLLGQPA